MKAFALKVFSIIFGVIALVIIGIVAVIYIWYNNNTQPVSETPQDTEIIVESGESFADIAQNLEEQGIIKNAFAFRVWAKLSGEAITVQAGKHTLSPHMTHTQIAHELLVGIEDVKILIKEGQRVEEIAEIFEINFDQTFNKQEFLKLAKPNEGKLFPDTYIFQKSTSAQLAFEKLNTQFKQKYAELGGPTTPQEMNETLTLASLIEREGKTDVDRPIIAGILLNRLNNETETVGLLQVDATLQYAINENTKKSAVWWPIPTPADKEINSKYNTYKIKGLPPAPICNPGISALKAAINPQKSNYLYYIHDNSGKAYYARTFDEHDANIGRYLQ